MPKPFANSAQITYSLVNGDWLLGIQTGNSTGDAGLPQMKHIKLSQLSDWVRGTYGQIWRYRGPFSASLPSDPQANDYFLATATFTVDGVTYTKDHLYAYNASGTWDDISDILTQYASQAQVTDIDDRLTVAEEKIDSMGDGIVYKGEVATYADLAGIVDPQTGWEYYVTADAAFYVYNGASWDQIDNGIVQTITDGDTAHAPSADAVYDALASEASARESEDSNLKSAIQGNSQRIENLEVAVSGSLVQTNTDSTMANTKTITNANSILPWAIMKRVGARATQFNQLFNGVIATTEINGITFTKVDNNTLTISGTASARISKLIGNPISVIYGHTYLIRGMESNSQYSGLIGNGYSGTSYIKTFSGMDIGNGVIITIDNSSVTRLFIEAVVENGVTLSKTYTIIPQVFDLTPMNEASLTADQFRSKFPASYYPYTSNPSIIPLNPSAFKVVGKNKWDEQWELGTYDSNGDPTPYNSGIRSKSTNYIEVLPNTEYYFAKPSTASYVFFYDAEKNFIETKTLSVSTNIFETSPNARFMRFAVNSAYGTVYNNNLMICLNSVTDKTYKAYSETTIDTSFTSDYLYVNENCHDYSENVLVNGVMRRKEHKGIVGEKNLATLAWGIVTDTLWEATLDVKPVSSSDVEANIICDNYLPSYASYLSQRVGEIAITTTGNVRVNNGSSSVSPTGTLLYELATPSTPTLHDPIPNIPCEDGTTVQAVTPQTDIVNAIDVPSTIAYMTKISS